MSTSSYIVDYTVQYTGRTTKVKMRWVQELQKIESEVRNVGVVETDTGEVIKVCFLTQVGLDRFAAVVERHFSTTTFDLWVSGEAQPH